MRDIDNSTSGLSGTLLIAHPTLQDPNFKHTVVLLSMHTEEDGALGVVLNRPLNKSLGDVQTQSTSSLLKDIPIYQGGPVEADRMILAAWKWIEAESVFRLYFGLTEDRLEEMVLTDPDIEARGFLGYSGWGEGQLEGEIAEDSWMVSPIDGGALQSVDGDELWRSILGKTSPEIGFMADFPDDPSVN